MHLHLARVVLLTPYKQILSLAMAIAGGSRISRYPRNSEFAADRHVVQMWARQDQYKARLALIHAGVLFWHVRRYSINAFYEAPSVLLATLALWAYSSFAKREATKSASAPTNHTTTSPIPTGIATQATTNIETAGTNHPARSATTVAPPSPANSTSSSTSLDLPPLIHLDRPTDDELVQLFVKSGGSMRANVAGVGDIYGRRGPERCLLEGAKLLGSLGFWGIGREWVEVLGRMAEGVRQGDG